LDIYDYADGRKISLRRVNDFTTGVNPLGPSNKARHAIRKEVRGLDVFPDEGIRYLTGYLSKVEGVERNNLIFGAGSTHLLEVLLQIARPGVVGVISPCCPRLEKTLQLHRAETRLITSDEEHGFSIEAEKLCEVMGNVDMMILSRPHDMTGAVTSDEGLDLLITESDRLGKVLVIDEAYLDYTAIASPLAKAVASRSTLILRTFSLYHGLAGLRLGYGAGSSRLVDEMNTVRPASLVNGPALHCAVTSLKDEGFRTRTLKFIEEEKTYFRQKLDRNKSVRLIDTPCNFVLLALHGDLEGLRKTFLERDILVDGFSGREGMVYLRLPVKRHKANAFFMRTLRRITGG
jgi:histidinol-phosphate/aromatic aminotransferase/cobyric acid decarboxylase-like protein